MIPVKVKSARGKKMRCGTFGISTMAHDRLGVWDSLSKVDSEARVFSVFTNALQDDQFFKQGDIIGFFQPIQEEDVLEHGLPEASLDEVFSDFSREPKDPKVGPLSVPLSEEERRFLSKNLSIKAPMEFLHRYQQFIFDYHDVCSKSKFDIGRTNVREHVNTRLFLTFRTQYMCVNLGSPFNIDRLIMTGLMSCLKREILK